VTTFGVSICENLGVIARKLIDDRDRSRMLRGEGSAAAAGSGRVRITKFETAAVQAGDEVDDCAGQVWRTRAVDVNGDAVQLQYGIVGFPFFIKIQPVGESGAAPVRDADPQSLPLALVTHQQFLDLLYGAISQTQV
jgi:hypothetical protein